MHRVLGLASLVLVAACSGDAADEWQGTSPQSVSTTAVVVTSDVATTVSAAPQASRPDTVLPVKVEVDVQYAADWALDVYYPDVIGPWPVAVYFHGGEYRKSAARPYASAVAEQGVVVFVPEFSSTPSQLSEAFHAGAEDAVCAMRFARAHAEDFGGNAGRVVTAGASYGADIAALMTVAADEFDGDCLVGPEISAAADGLVGLDGIYDFGSLPETLGFQERNTPEELQRASALTYVAEADLDPTTPFTLFTGKEPGTQDQASALRDALVAAGCEVRMVEQPDVEHNAYIGVVPGTAEALVEIAFG